MIDFEKIILRNGLTVICHQDPGTPMVAVSILYSAGSKFDPPGKTGLAHIFEHLMFSGTRAVPDFDMPIQMAGGENNAYTNSDFVQYYSFAPADNLDTLLWLESDRMQNIKLRKRQIETQKKVVLEEFNESCLNVPYGDVWHYILPVLYPNHPYRSPVIGQSTDEIMGLSRDDFIDFQQKFYHPVNAILSVSGMVSTKDVFNKADKWFGHIPPRQGDTPFFPGPVRNFGHGRDWIVRGNVPAVAFFLVFPMPERRSEAFYHLDFVADVLASGRSARLYRALMKNRQLVSHIDAYTTGTEDPGLFIIEGKLHDGINPAICEQRIWSELDKIKLKNLKKTTLRKLKNNLESEIVFSEINVVNNSTALCYFEKLGNARMINEEIEKYLSIDEDKLSESCHTYLNPDNCYRFLYVPDDFKMSILRRNSGLSNFRPIN